MKVEVSETTPIQLDWLVAKCEKQYPSKATGEPFLYEHRLYQQDFCPTTDPAQGQPILERERISVTNGSPLDEGFSWFGYYAFIGPKTVRMGPSMLIAGLRCYVASKLGEEVEIPEELS